jgi:ectoine hydroxylase-related dioxygenase (phytanoyl-CoA dioxygenase family)
MVALETLPNDASTDQIMAAMARDGACIIEGLISEAEVDATMAQVMPFVERTKTGRDTFTGLQTRRTGALVARSAACRDIVMNQPIMDAAGAFLLRFAERIVLHLTQTIYIGPGQGAQMLHRDRLAWGKHLPRDIEPQFNTIWALTDFTKSNGATRVVPGSQNWQWRREPTEDEICQAEMKKGSVLLYSGSVMHSGGQNESTESRMGLNITYCLGWLRQEENQYLSCPPDVAKDFDIELQELLGYTQGNYALGYYSDPDGLGEMGAGILLPERAVGARARTDIDIFNQPEE